MFNFVSDFAPLIQLIVGSIFLNDYYAIKRWPKIEKEKREKIKTKTPDDFVRQYVTRHRYQEGIESNKRLSKSVLIILALYGCICLFYCATCHVSADNIVQYCVSCLGPITSTIIVIVYLILALCIYGHIYRPWFKIVTVSVFVLLIITFLLFYCIKPLLLYEELEPTRVYFNALILCTLFIWFAHNIKKMTYSLIFIPYWEDVIERLNLLFGLQEKRPSLSTPNETYKLVINTISDSQSTMNRKTKKILMNVCCRCLKSNSLYCKQNKNGEFMYNDRFISEQIKSIKDFIRSSKLSEYDKKKLIKNILQKVTIRPEDNFYREQAHLILFNKHYKRSVKIGINAIRRLEFFGAYV